MKKLRSFFLLLFACPLAAQDLSGTWEGTGGAGAPYLQLVILKVGDNYVGYTYDIDRTGFCKADFSSKFDPTTKKLNGKGVAFIERTYNHILCVYNLTYSYLDGVHYLIGSASPKSTPLRVFSPGYPGTVRLIKESSKVDTTDFIRREIVNAVGGPRSPVVDTPTASPEVIAGPEEKIIALKNERRDDTLSVIPLSERNFKLKIFDNGITDGDSISLLFNGRLIASQIGVTEKVLELPLELESGKIHNTITLVAHNLGRIPPNTATIIIEAGNKKYTLSSSADLKKNNSIIIQYE
jgi:hypothetical protein